MPTDLKQRIAEMKEAAEKAREATDAEAVPEQQYVAAMVGFTRRCNPSAILALVDEVERQAAEIERLENENKRLIYSVI